MDENKTPVPVFGTNGVLRSGPHDKPWESNTSNSMSPDVFQMLLDELDGNSLETLKTKNARYSSNGDSLHNFRKGGDVFGGTPAQACWGYMTKHLVALRDMVQRDDFSNREDFLEKCQDTINYIRFLWCIGNDGKCAVAKATPVTNTLSLTQKIKKEIDQL